MKKVLVVDDNLDTVTTLRLALGDVGYEVACAFNGEEGYQKAKEFLPDLILLDIMMPVMDGYTMNQLLKEDPNTKNIPVIIISAKNETASLFSSGNNAGIEGYFVKPFALKELIRKVEEISNGKRGEDQAQRKTS